ncbi:hypothetical protein Tco_0086556 [Tanacetum coccineum]
MTGALPSDTIKNPKLIPYSTSSARSYPTWDPQSSSNSFKSVNAIQTCFKSTTNIQKEQLQVNTLTVNEIETPKPKEPKESLEDEFADLHLNLPVLEVLAHVTIYDSLLDKYMLNVGLLEETEDVLGLADETKLKAKIVVGEGLTRSIFGVREIDFREENMPYWTTIDFRDNHLPREWEIARDFKVNPLKDILVFRKMVEFLGTIPINLKRNMWESEKVIDNKIDWIGHQKEGDGAWHIRIELIDPHGEIFDRAFQSIPTTRKLSPKENPSDILNLAYFHHS